MERCRARRGAGRIVIGHATRDSAVDVAVASAAAHCLRAPGAFDLDTPFALLGMDSLATIEMAAALEVSLGIALPPELMLDCPNGRSLAERIVRLRAADQIARHDDPFALMFADAVLPDDARPMQAASALTSLRGAKRILLTGATGFLGGALLKELLESSDADILCLVRGRTLPPAAHAFEQRVGLLYGDLSLPGLGLTERQLGALSRDVDAILHCGAEVNWVYPYPALRAANVTGTLELVRLACPRGIPFHFISSLSVCYSTAGPRTIDETCDPLPWLRGVRLGYAQTKIVAEALVRQAAARGLPVRIYRPSLISGESTGGAYNRDDLISALIRGCVRMGTAPDLDWKLDCEPVDYVARAILSLSGEDGQVFHMGHNRPRHWRECALWMRLYGYPMRLVPYHAWLRQLDRETSPSSAGAASHPLRALRTFFLAREGTGGLTIPELYEENRRTRADGSATRHLLTQSGVEAAPLDARLLDIYFGAFRANGDLPAPAAPLHRGRGADGSPWLAPAFMSRLIHQRVIGTRLLDAGSDHSIVSELTAWRSQRVSGLFLVSATLEDDSVIEVRLKVKAADVDVIAVGESLAGLVDPAVGAAYTRWSDRVGFSGSHLREIEIYRQRDARFTTHAPALLGSIRDSGSSAWVLALENVRSATRMDSAGHDGVWTHDDIRAAIEGLAALHAIWYGRETELRGQSWIGHIQTTDGTAEMSDLWTALGRHAAPNFSSWTDADISAIQHRLIAGIPQWWPALEAGPRTLIHNDFNPRNICLRDGRLCAYDWELATIGAPQRDLAELLCFVLTPDAGAEEVQRWIDCHRLALARETGRSIDAERWQAGFRAGLYDLMINRLATYALVHRVRRQPFLPRIVGTWRRLYAHHPFGEGT